MFKAYDSRLKKKVTVKDPRIVKVRTSRGTRYAVRGYSDSGTKLFTYIKKDVAEAALKKNPSLNKPGFKEPKSKKTTTNKVAENLPPVGRKRAKAVRAR